MISVICSLCPLINILTHIIHLQFIHQIHANYNYQCQTNYFWCDTQNKVTSIMALSTDVTKWHGDSNMLIEYNYTSTLRQYVAFNSHTIKHGLYNANFYVSNWKLNYNHKLFKLHGLNFTKLPVHCRTTFSTKVNAFSNNNNSNNNNSISNNNSIIIVIIIIIIIIIIIKIIIIIIIIIKMIIILILIIVIIIVMK